MQSLRLCFRTVSFQKVVKLAQIKKMHENCFRTVSFQKVVKQGLQDTLILLSFRTVSFQKVVKLPILLGSLGGWF